MQVGILGPLKVVDDAQPIEVGGARLRALLIRLAAGAGGWITVSELVDALWADDPPGDEVNALQSLVSRLRRALPAAELIESGPAGYRLAIDPEAVDGIKFERLAVRGRRQLADGHPEEASVALEEGLALWRGPALTEVAGVPYATIWAERLEKLRLAAIDDRAAAGLQLGRHPDLIADLEEITAQHPLRERSHELLIRALAGSGRQGDALAVYDRLSRALATELGLDPPVHIQRLQTAVLREDPEVLVAADRPTPATTTERVRRTNLRAPLTSFVGRTTDVILLVKLIDRARLVTLVGPGGAGKTRLVSEAAGWLRDHGTDGVWMVELAPVTDPDAVASTVLSSLGALDRQLLDRTATAPSHRDAPTRLVETLANHDVVLILDNCEHLLDATAKLAEFLLGQCRRLTVLATSREPLGIVGESLWPVQPLAVPESNAAAAVALKTPAVELFIDRATLVRPGFRVTDANLPAVVEICRRLDGLPLAIELAAARLRNLTVEAIASRLGNRFRLLTGGNRTAMPRHQTLRAVVAWSWELLTDSERVLAERLSVFPGGATAETAEAICARAAPDRGAALPEDSVADLLMSLADKSLLVVVEPANGDDGAQPRYRMLETIREFAADRLVERGETAALRAAHTRYFLELAETAEPRLRRADQLTWTGRLSAERDNLLAALRFAVETADADTAVRLGAALSWYWTLIGRHDEAANWLDQALSVPGDGPAEAYAIAFIIHTISAMAAGRGEPTEEQVEKMLALGTGIPLEDRHPLLTLVEPGIAMIRDDAPGAKAALERNLVHPDPWARAMLNLMVAVQAENDGDAEAMMVRIPLALAGFQALGDRWGTGTALSTLANLRSAQGRIDEAIEALQEARALMTELHAVDDEAFTLSRIGMLRIGLGDEDGARQDLEAAAAMAEGTGTSMTAGYSTFTLALLAHYGGRTDEARRIALKALDQVDRAPFSPPQVKAGIYCALASFDIAGGDLDSAVRNLLAAYEGVESSHDMPLAAGLAAATADLALARGDAERAAELLGASIRLRGMEDLSNIEVRRVTGAAQAALDPEAYAVRHEVGLSLTREGAMELVKASI